MKFKIAVFLSVIIAFSAGTFLFWKIKFAPKKIVDEIHFHAGFQIYIDNQLQDYSGYQFMHINPCTEDEEHNEDEQLEKAHLHDKVGNVVHVHRNGAKWSDLFQNLNVAISPEAKGYINGEQVENFLNTDIAPFASLVVFEGKNDEIDLKLLKAVTKSEITEIEAKSETCGS